MHRLVAILLIPFFVVGNSLAHSHEPAAHLSPSQGRAHIHVGSAPQHVNSHEAHGHSHHGHSHGHDHGKSHAHASDQNHISDNSKPAPVEKPVDHESDAVYVSTADFFGTTSARISIEVTSCAVVEAVEDYLSGIRTNSLHDRPPLASTTQLPLYLLFAALRL